MSAGDEEISLKELLLKFGYWWRYALAHWKVILLVAVLVAGGALGYALYKDPTYTGTLTFVLSNDNKSGGLSSIAGQFGIDLSGMNGSDGAFEGENIMELLKSRKIICGAMFKPLPQGTLLINRIAESAEFFRKWKQKERLARVIPFTAAITDPIQDSLIDVLHDYIMKHYLDISKPDKKLSFYSVSTTSNDEDISIYLTKYMVEEAARLYIEQKTKTSRNNLAMLQHEADSIRERLGGAIYTTASQTDNTFNLNPALQTRRAPVQQSQVQIQVLGAAYAEVVKNLEIAKITLMKETPLYQIIDEPSRPLVRDRISKAKALLLGGIVGGFLCVVVVLIRGIFKTVMKG